MFKVSNYSEAINFYTQALEINPDSAIILSNRSFCHLKLENYGLAEADATQAL